MEEIARLAKHRQELTELARFNLQKAADEMKKKSLQNQVKFEVGDVVKVLLLL